MNKKQVISLMGKLVFIIIVLQVTLKIIALVVIRQTKILQMCF
ncbi:hypothetical protein [Clostridium algidicarnis]|nr:hypothetical protein [Clostridium algidicarnis]